MTVFNSQPRRTRESVGVVFYTGPGDFIVNRFNSSVSFSSSTYSGILLNYFREYCDPSTDKVQFTNITNSYMTMPDNPDKTANAVWGINPAAGVSGRPAQSYLANNLIENVNLNSLPIVYALNSLANPVFTMNNVFKN